MAATARWRALKKSLEAKSGTDFERAIFPLLKVRWPDLVHPKSLKYLDRYGIDQVLVVEGHPRLGAVIQCKGFEVLTPLSELQISQVNKSVDSFEASRLRTDQYVLIYNRFGADQVFEKTVKERLKQLVDSGSASFSSLWNLNTLADELSETLLEFLLRELAKKATRKQEEERKRFLFGDVTITQVPFSVGSMRLATKSAPSISLPDDGTIGDPIDRISLANRSVSLILGYSGSGKSTLAYRLAEIPDHRLVYVPASALNHIEKGPPSENSLAQAIIEYLGIFDDSVDLTDEQREQLSHLAGPLLAYKFRTEDSRLILLIDAIDENLFYSSVKGFLTLTNELARALCPIIFTTRLGQFIDRFEAFEGALTERSPFGVRNVKLLTLHSWLPQQVHEYVQRAIQITIIRDNREVRSRLTDFINHLSSGRFVGLALDHPLFLAMTADLLASGDSTIYTDRFELYENWAQQKLRRDFSTDRLVPRGFENIRLLISTMMDLMSTVAAQMHGLLEYSTEPSEYIDETSVRKMAAEAFGEMVSSDLYTVTAFLEPVRSRAFGKLHFRFFHKSFQDFFAARWLYSRHDEARECITAIRDFLPANTQSQTETGIQIQLDMLPPGRDDA